MAKFKPFHEFQRPLIGFTLESFPRFHEDKFRLWRNSNTERPSLQISERGSIFMRYRSDRGEIFFLGQWTYHPKLLLRVLFYGYATGVRSSRKFAER